MPIFVDNIIQLSHVKSHFLMVAFLETSCCPCDTRCGPGVTLSSTKRDPEFSQWLKVKMATGGWI